MSRQDCSAKLLAANPLNGYNFLIWERLVRKVLETYKLEHTITTPLKTIIKYDGSRWYHSTDEALKAGYQLACGTLLGSMEPSIKSDCTKLKWNAYEIMCYLQKEYGDKIRRRESKSLRDFHSCIMLEHESFKSYEWKVM